MFLNVCNTIVLVTAVVTAAAAISLSLFGGILLMLERVSWVDTLCTEFLFCAPYEEGFGGEDDIEFFESLVHSLGVECPHKWNSDKVECTKQQEGGPANRSKKRRRDFHDHSVADRPADDTPCAATGTDAQGIDFDGIEPRDRQPSHTKESSVTKNEHSGSNAVTLQRREKGNK